MEKCLTCGKIITAEDLDVIRGEGPDPEHDDVWCSTKCLNEWEFNEEMDRMKEV